MTWQPNRLKMIKLISIKYYGIPLVRVANIRAGWAHSFPFPVDFPIFKLNCARLHFVFN